MAPQTSQSPCSKHEPSTTSASKREKPLEPQTGFLRIAGRYVTREDRSFIARSAETEELRYWDSADDSRFAGIAFFANSYDEAIRYPIHLCRGSRTSARSNLLIFTDGSLRNPPDEPPSKLRVASIGISHRMIDGAANGWIDASYGIHGVKESLSTEILALHRALCIAYHEVDNWVQRTSNSDRSHPPSIPQVTIFSDCLDAMRWTSDCHYGRIPVVFPASLPEDFDAWLLAAIDRLLQVGVRIEIHWVPGHAGIEGNTRADRLAVLGSAYMDCVHCEEDFYSGVAALPLLVLLRSSHSHIIAPAYYDEPVVDFSY
ncbi:hypothetical protein M426DRAFT_17884 [Hypoxylon sp. CI-4A]|nr:hypothetical protein M426DRAFT_17884 [Hypoxylon sp. CI-4A]